MGKVGKGTMGYKIVNSCFRCPINRIILVLIESNSTDQEQLSFIDEIESLAYNDGTLRVMYTAMYTWVLYISLPFKYIF